MYKEPDKVILRTSEGKTKRSDIRKGMELGEVEDRTRDTQVHGH